jgi:hypothetical protein
MGTATWSVITNPSAAGIGTFLPALCVILAVATSIIRERFLVAPLVEVVAALRHILGPLRTRSTGAQADYGKLT